VDEFPHYRAWDEPSRYGTEQFRRFHEIMSSHGVQYLVAVTPRVARSPLDPQETAEREWDDGERRMLEELREASVSFAVHGWCHRTRVERPRRRSELAGLGPEELDRLLDSADAELRGLGVEPAVFVPPFNLFDAPQLPSLARRYEVVCGGPETVSALGFRRPPAWLDGCVYLPSYPPLYGRAQEVLPALRPLVEADVRLWVPVTLHWGWEADEDWSSLSALARELAPVAAGWEQFLAAVRTSAAAADNVGS
jgi:hypothetical protein